MWRLAQMLRDCCYIHLSEVTLLIGLKLRCPHIICGFQCQLPFARMEINDVARFLRIACEDGFSLISKILKAFYEYHVPTFAACPVLIAVPPSASISLRICQWPFPRLAIFL